MKNCGLNPQHFKNKTKILKTLYKVITVQETGSGKYWQALTGTRMWMTGNTAWSSQKERFGQKQKRGELETSGSLCPGDLKRNH